MARAGIAVAALIALAAAGTAGAWYTGTQLEGVLRQNIAQGNEQLRSQFPGADIALELVDFEQGIFSSQARYRLVSPAAQRDAAEPGIVVRDRIEHGPLPLSRLMSFKLWPVMAVSHAELERTDGLAGLFAASAGHAPVSAISSVGYGGRINGEIQLAPLSWNDDQIAGTFSGLSAVYATDTAGAEFMLSGRVDSLELQGTALVSLLGVDFNLDRQRHDSGLYLGSGKVEVDQLAAEVDGEPALVLSELLQTDVTTLNEDGAHVQLGYRLGSVSYGAQRLGSVDMGWTLSRLDPQAMLELAGIYNSALLGAAGEQPQVALERGQAALEQLLDGHPRLSLDNFSVRTANGESRLSLGVELDRPSSLALPPAVLVPQLIGNLEARLVLSKPMLTDVMRHKALFEPGADMAAVEQQAVMTAEMVAGMAEMLQLGRVEGDNILSQLSYAGGAIKLNGQSIALEDLFALLSGVPSMP